jgi:hypothetical protein
MKRSEKPVAFADPKRLPYEVRECLLSDGARELMAAFWRTMARRLMPDMPVEEAVAGLKELHAAGLVQIVTDENGAMILELK